MPGTTCARTFARYGTRNRGIVLRLSLMAARFASSNSIMFLSLIDNLPTRRRLRNSPLFLVPHKSQPSGVVSPAGSSSCRQGTTTGGNVILSSEGHNGPVSVISSRSKSTPRPWPLGGHCGEPILIYLVGDPLTPHSVVGFGRAPYAHEFPCLRHYDPGQVDEWRTGR